ncbi:fumarylacetoacetate hydrolase family protein [Microbacterium pseudoresistens]|uniref:2-oxo-3-hexenedioate decarboxylase n=1 Tax=Microbacterium pseudoresistens TaxID=640634 RepID=A0A7Y9ETQ2_9MICO|nr:fumarylacetoacetate hydrolase family protein [Microbacterium pseudoresistens]NYD53775.1 2-oxo-3-hexenedioate decarboxylase [Microbacterium pseudoresistens]
MSALDPSVVDRIAHELLERETERRDGGRITDVHPELDLEIAYEAQRVLIERKVAAGQTVVGVKLGLTSRAKQLRMGISSPLTAVLTDTMAIPTGAPLDATELIHPRVEPEIAFVMRERLAGPGVTAATALAAVRSVHAGLEIIDSRFADFSFALPDVVADNASSARYLISPDGISPEGLDLWLEAAVLLRNGEVVDTATGAAVQGHPAEALALAANELDRRGGAIEAGAIVLTGGLTDAVAIEPGDDVAVRFTHLGSLSLSIGGHS